MVAVCILLGGSTLAVGQVQLGFGMAVPGLSIGINIPTYPELAPIPGYPVYYAPRLSTNLFFYDGLYWVFVGDNWYYSSWYDGPWTLADPATVPDFILRVPILYYRSPPPFFLCWNRHAPPRWGEHWGRGWEERRHGWDRWDRAHVPPRAPLPGYQRQYPHGRYPGADRQRTLENRFYPYTPRDPGDRARLREAPQFGQRIAPQPNRSAPGQRRPEQRPDRYRAPPGAQRPDRYRAPPGAQQPAFAPRPSPPARTGERRPDANRRPHAQPPRQPNNPGASGQQQGRSDRQPRRDTGRGDQRPDRPPG